MKKILILCRDVTLILLLLFSVLSANLHIESVEQKDLTMNLEGSSWKIKFKDNIIFSLDGWKGNGEKIYAIDSTKLGGKFAIQTFNTHAHFDNIIVKSENYWLPSGLRTIFSDNFASGKDNHWVKESGIWGVETVAEMSQGNYCEYSQENAKGGEYKAYPSNIEVGRGTTFEVDIKIISGKRDAKIDFYDKNDKRVYTIGLGGWGKKLVIYKHGKGILASYGSYTDIEFNKNYHLDIEFTEDKITLTLSPYWIGNALVFPVGSDKSIGLFWSQVVMVGLDRGGYSPGFHPGYGLGFNLPSSLGYFLTDEVESEGVKLVSFNVSKDSGEVIEYGGTWKFRDLYTTSAEHRVWVKDNYVFHLVDLELRILNIISFVGAAYVEFMVEGDSYGFATAKTRDGLMTCDLINEPTERYRELLGPLGRIYFTSHPLENDGWISIYEPKKGQEGSAAFVLLDHSRTAYPAAASSHIDYIQLHLLPTAYLRPLTLSLSKDDYFKMRYLLIVSPEKDNYDWVDSAIYSAKSVIDEIK